MSERARLAIVRVGAATILFAQMLLYPRVWETRELPDSPNVPLFEWLPQLPPALNMIVYVAMLLALVLAASGWQARRASIFVAVAYAVMTLFDQIRFQSHFTVTPVLLLIATAHSPSPRQSLRFVRFALAGVYFFAGLSKLNVQYRDIVHPAMLQPLIDEVSFLEAPLKLWWMAPLVEMCVGVAVFWPGEWRTRRFVVVAVLGMHAFIVTMLMVANKDPTVLPLNLGYAVAAFAVTFDRADSPSRISLRETTQTNGGRLALVFALVLPLCAMTGFGDTYMSHAYYAGTEGRMRWYVTANVWWKFPQLLSRPLRPPQIPRGAEPVPKGMYELPMHGGYSAKVGQAVIGEARMADAIKEQICDYAATSPDQVMVRYYGNSERISGDRTYRDSYCGQSLGFWLRFGGFSTAVIGGDGPTRVLAGHGKPTF